MNDRVCVATMTWARTEPEAGVLRRSLSLLAATGLPITVADRGNSATFLDFLHGLPNVRVVIPGEHGLLAQVRASMQLAAGTASPSILYVEPDKELFFRDHVRAFLERALERPHDGVVLAARSDESFATYPPMQRYTEGVINHLCAEVLERQGDYSYGPFLMSAALLPHITTLSGELGWGWRPSVFAAAHRLGLGVEHVPGDYVCPPDQRDEDDSERTHRLRQLSQNILGLLT